MTNPLVTNPPGPSTTAPQQYTIDTIVGNGAETSSLTTTFSGDNGPATSAELDYPKGVAVDSAGILYIAYSDNNRVRKVSQGVITTVAGNGTTSFTVTPLGDDGPATSARRNNPIGVALDFLGNLYIADTILRGIVSIPSVSSAAQT